MRLDPDRRSENVEDRRGVSLRRGATIGGGGAVLALVLALLGAPQELVRSVLQGGGGAEESGPREVDPAQEPTAKFASQVLRETEDVWDQVFAQAGKRYEKPTMVLFSDGVSSACGEASSAVGPFYCPGDHKLYLDLNFFQELDRRFGAPGDFAQAYVIAHEVGHHVQTLTGISERNMARRQRASETEANQLSVKQELQADCFAGIWAHESNKARHTLEEGDIEEGLRAATAIGDDTLQKRARGYVVPESFTHGSSAQRVEWFTRGFKTGAMKSCDTFGGQL